MNVAFGFREQDALAETYARVEAAGYRDNFRMPQFAGGTYLNDALGNTVELLIAGRELDPGFGFSPHPLFRRNLAWPQPSVGPARP
jgi:hypothetical protein